MYILAPRINPTWRSIMATKKKAAKKAKKPAKKAAKKEGDEEGCEEEVSLRQQERRLVDRETSRRRF